jgi:hypothetical protein
VDGKKWLNDWHADDFVENAYGSEDSVVDLTEAHVQQAEVLGRRS